MIGMMNAAAPDGEALALGERDALGESDHDGDNDGEPEAEGESEGLPDGDPDGDSLALGLKLADSL